MKSLKNNNRDKFIIMDEAHLFFEPLSNIEGFKALQLRSQELGSAIKQAIINRLEIDKQLNIESN